MNTSIAYIYIYTILHCTLGGIGVKFGWPEIVSTPCITGLHYPKCDILHPNCDISYLEERSIGKCSGQKDETKPLSIRPILELFQKQHWGKPLRDNVEHIWAFLSTQIPSWTVLNWHRMIQELLCSRIYSKRVENSLNLPRFKENS